MHKSTVKKLCRASSSTLVELTGRPISMQKVYNLRALCTKIGVCRRLVYLQIKLNCSTASSFTIYNWRPIRLHGWSDVLVTASSALW